MIFDSFSIYEYQQYLWMISSFLLACLVFLLFVQWWQVLSLFLSRNEEEKTKILNELTKRYEITFTSLVVFGWSMFAIFPLFYSTSFWWAYFVWFAILFLFIIEWVSFKYRKKVSNFLWSKTYEIFLFLNWLFAPLLLWIAVATFFTGSNFVVEKWNILWMGESAYAISSWTSSFHWLEALWNNSQWAFITNISLGISIVLATIVLACLNLMKNIDNTCIYLRAKKTLYFVFPAFLVFFLIFLFKLFTISGFAYDPITKEIFMEPYKYLNNFIEMPQFGILFLSGVILFATWVITWIFQKDKISFWISGFGIIFVVFSLLSSVWLNNTVFYPSLDLQYGLTIENASASLYTLEIIAYSSLFLPFVIFYITYVWTTLTKVDIKH